MSTAIGNGKDARDPAIDGIRGIAILLVVLGHALQHHGNGTTADLLYRAIYSFHMPLFIALSGTLAFGRIESSWLAVVRKKFLQLVIPFLAWHLVGYFISAVRKGSWHSLPEWYYQLWLAPDMGLWFLWVLFLCFAGASAAVRLPERYHVPGLLGLGILLYGVTWQAGGLALLRWLYPFFIAGYCIAKYGKYAQAIPTGLLAAVAGIAWMALVPFYTPGNPLPVERMFSDWGLPAGGLTGLAFRYLVAAAGIATLSALVALLTRHRAEAVPRWLLFTGAASMDIYVIHQWFTVYPPGRGPLFVAAAFGLGLAGALALSFLVLRRFTWTRRIFLGLP